MGVAASHEAGDASAGNVHSTGHAAQVVRCEVAQSLAMQVELFSLHESSFLPRIGELEKGLRLSFANYLDGWHATARERHHALSHEKAWSPFDLAEVAGIADAIRPVRTAATICPTGGSTTAEAQNARPEEASLRALSGSVVQVMECFFVESESTFDRFLQKMRSFLVCPQDDRAGAQLPVDTCECGELLLAFNLYRPRANSCRFRHRNLSRRKRRQ